MVITERHAYAAFRAANDTPTFNAWGASQRLTVATEPMVRGTRSMGGSLLPLRNARHVIDERVPDVTPEPAPILVVCTRLLSIGRPLVARDTPEFRAAMLLEGMRLNRRSFDRGFAGDFRARRNGGARELLPLV